MMATQRLMSKTFSIIEVSSPDPARAESGLRLLGRMIARAYARDSALSPTRWDQATNWTSHEEESRDRAEH